MIKALSLDFHGTLAVPYPSAGAIYAEVGAKHGLTHNADVLEERFHAAFSTIRDSWDVPYGADEVDARDFWLAIIEHTFPEDVSNALQHDLFEAFARGHRWRLLPGAREAIEWARRHGIPVAISSNFDLRLKRLLKELDLPAVDEILVSSLFGAPKPDPELLLMAASLFGIEVEELLHVGDNAEEDGGAARAAGCRYRRVKRGEGIDVSALAEFIGG